MDKQIFQDLRYKLQKRISRLNSIDDKALFLITLKQFFVYFKSELLFVSIINDLTKRIADLENSVETILTKNQYLYGETEEEAAAIGYRVLFELDKNPNLFRTIGFILSKSGDVDNMLEAIRLNYLIPFYEYIDEHLDDQRAILALLLKYKRRSEWFYRKQLLGLGEDKKPKERELVMDLYSYLFDNGIDFYIEPSSVTGEIDIISEQKSDDPLLLDAKVFDAAGRGKSYIIKAFHQIFTYTQQFNKPVGYLLIYKNTDRDLHLNIKTDSAVPYLQYNNKTIFFVVVDIFDHQKPVSQRKKVKAVEINEDDFVETTGDSK